MGTDAADFAIVTDGCSGMALAPRASCAVDVRFTPQTAGPKNAALFLGATPGGIVGVTLAGTGF